MTKLNLKRLTVGLAAFGLLSASSAWTRDARAGGDDEAAKTEQAAEPSPEQAAEALPEPAAEPLPEPSRVKDPRPPVPVPIPPQGVVEQAGIGSDIAYARAGVLELGGSAGLIATSEFTAISLNPSIGWFVADNVQVSGILGFAHISADTNDAMIVSLLVESSYHLPFTQAVFGFMGLGMGGSHVDDAGIGFAVAPRIGAKIMVGRSGILSPSLSYQYTTHDALEMQDGTALLAVTTALTAHIGYTVMW